MRGLQVAAATVNVDDPISMPDRKIFVNFTRKKHRRRVADNTDSVRVGAGAVRFHPAPDAGVVITAGEAMDQVKVLTADSELQIVRQAGEKP